MGICPMVRGLSDGAAGLYPSAPTTRMMKAAQTAIAAGMNRKRLGMTASLSAAAPACYATRERATLTWPAHTLAGGPLPFALTMALARGSGRGDEAFGASPCRGGELPAFHGGGLVTGRERSGDPVGVPLDGRETPNQLAAQATVNTLVRASSKANQSTRVSFDIVF
jgi:hypothetical protein